MTSDMVREVTQSIIAITIIVGGGAILFLQPTSGAVPFVTGLMGGVIGFYFNQTTMNRAIAQVKALTVRGEAQ